MTLTVGSVTPLASSFDSTLQGILTDEMKAMQKQGGSNNSSGGNSQGSNGFLGMVGVLSEVGTNIQTYQSEQSMFRQNQGTALSELNQDAQSLHNASNQLQNAVNPNNGTGNATSVGGAVQTFVDAYNTYHKDLGSASDYVQGSYSSLLDSSWSGTFANGSGLGITKNSDGTLSFSQDTLNKSIANGTNPKTNTTLGEAMTFVAGAGSAAQSYATAPMAQVMTQNPYPSDVNQLQHLGQTYNQMMQVEATKQEMSVLLNTKA